MFKSKFAKPDDIFFKLVKGEPCFYTYFAFAHTIEENGERKRVFTEKQLNAIAREKFDIEQFEKNDPKRKGMWVLVEDPGFYELQFFPWRDEENHENSIVRMELIFELLAKKRVW